MEDKGGKKIKKNKHGGILLLFPKAECRIVCVCVYVHLSSIHSEGQRTDKE